MVAVVETMGGHTAWLVGGIALITVGFIVGVILLALAFSDMEVRPGIVGIIFVLLIPLGIVITVRQNWELSRIECQRVAANYNTAHRWTKALGCYLQDDSGRFVPETAYNTTRIERGGK